jgi:DNA-binding MarR family transcriptional regulator
VNDAIDQARAQWAKLFPQVNTQPLDIFGRLRRIAELLQERSDEVLSAHGISRSEFDIISALGRFGRPMTLTEISVETLTSAPGTTKRIKKLLSAGLISREPNPLDGRGALISLTAVAEPLLEPILNDISRLEHSLITELSPDERSDLVRALRVLLKSIEVPAQNELEQVSSIS